MVDVATHFRAAIGKVLVAALTKLGLAAAAQGQLRRVRREEFLTLYALSRCTAVPAAVDGDASIGMLLSLRRG